VKNVQCDKEGSCGKGIKGGFKEWRFEIQGRAEGSKKTKRGSPVTKESQLSITRCSNFNKPSLVSLEVFLVGKVKLCDP